MKILYLLRHAKAVEKLVSGNDFARKLTKAGRNDVATIAKHIQNFKIKNGLIISSPAKRAIETATIVAKKINYPFNKIKTNNLLYDNSGNILSVLKEVNEYNSVMLVGHNPSFNLLMNNLCETDIENIPKCGLVGIKFDVKEWSDIGLKKGTLMFLHSPKSEIKLSEKANNLKSKTMKPKKMNLKKELQNKIADLINSFVKSMNTAENKKIKKAVRKASKTVAKAVRNSIDKNRKVKKGAKLNVAKTMAVQHTKNKKAKHKRTNTNKKPQALPFVKSGSNGKSLAYEKK